MPDIKIRAGFCLTGSFCTFSRAIEQMRSLKNSGFDLLPIMSYNAGSTDTRFGTAKQHIETITNICGRPPIMTINDAEPIGPKNMTDIMIIAPCTGNTLAKLARSITDTPVTMAVKSHLRAEKPVLIALSTNDALAGSFKNIGELMNLKHYYFVPFSQDDYIKKPNSLSADFTLIESAALLALKDKQIQPLISASC